MAKMREPDALSGGLARWDSATCAECGATDVKVWAPLDEVGRCERCFAAFANTLQGQTEALVRAWGEFLDAVRKELPPLALRPVWSKDWWIVASLVGCLAMAAIGGLVP